MQLCTVVKLHTTPQQHTALTQTLRKCNAACDAISTMAFGTGAFRQYDLHALVYHAVKADTHLNANHVVRAIAKVAHAYKLDTKTQRTFQPLGGIELDKDLLTWKVDAQNVSLNTVQGRLHLPFLCSAEQKALLQGRKGQTDLLLRDGAFYLSCAVTIHEAEAFTPTGVIGIDLGLVNVATDSEGHQYTGEPVKKARKKYRRLRQLLQPRKTRSSRKHLQKARRKESRFVKDTNHCISKTLVQRALNRQKALCVELLTAIRQRANGLHRAVRTELHSWAFLQFKTFLHYKAKRAGVTVIEVDPRYSSQTCSACGHCERANRKSQESFCCIHCGLKMNADVNAALNLKAWGELSAALMFRSTAIA